MTDQDKWKELCGKAAVEEDPKRLLELVEEMNRLFEQMDREKKKAPNDGTVQ